MRTWIYKGNNKASAYLYVTAENDFSAVPDALISMLGDLEYVVDIDLSEREQLAQADIQEVREKLVDKKFYLQLPPGEFANKIST
ncbi:MAG: YcgL domain-containing protein [Pseudomonadota bacterium]